MDPQGEPLPRGRPDGPRPGRGGHAALVGPGRAAAAEGQVTWAVHISLAPTWFDPAETPGIITPFMVLYALHDGLVKPMPGYRGASAALLKAKVEAMGPLRVRFTLKQPWPDFMTFYATPATGAAWIVPKEYVERVGPIIEPAFLNGVGPRLEVHGLGLIANHAYSAPYEDVRLGRP